MVGLVYVFPISLSLSTIDTRKQIGATHCKFTFCVHRVRYIHHSILPVLYSITFVRSFVCLYYGLPSSHVLLFKYPPQVIACIILMFYIYVSNGTKNTLLAVLTEFCFVGCELILLSFTT